MGVFKIELIEDGEIYDVYSVKAIERKLNFSSYFLIYRATKWIWVPAYYCKPYIEKRLS